MKTLIVIHIPKAAGTTLRVILEKQYLPEHLYKIEHDIQGDQMKLAMMPDGAKRRLRVIFGHFCFGLHQTLPQSCTHMTILREPIARVLSLYRYIKRSRGHYLHQNVQDMSLSEFVSSGVTCTADNAMVRQLCGDDWFLQRPYTDMAIPFGEVNQEHLEKAKANLDSFSVAGTVASFDQTLALCEAKYGWKVENYRRKNKAPRQQPSVASDLTPVWEHNQLDAELYEYAEGRLNEAALRLRKA